MLPILVQTEWLSLYSYPFLMGLAWAIGFKWARRNWILQGYHAQGFTKVFCLIFLVAWIGSKLGFWILSSHDYAKETFLSSQFWLGGGFVFYGGVLLSLVVIQLMNWRGWTQWAQFAVTLPALAFAHAIGRIGCFLAGCCYGTPSSGPWTIHLHQAERHPVQLYEAGLLLLLAWGLERLVRKGRSAKMLLATYLIGYSVIRFLLEFVRGDHIRGIWFGALSSSQIVALLLVMVGIVLFWREKHE